MHFKFLYVWFCWFMAVKSERGQRQKQRGFRCNHSAERLESFLKASWCLLCPSFWLFCVCFVCFPVALCSDNLPRCPTFLLAGSFTHSTRKWISEMWWRLKAEGSSHSLVDLLPSFQSAWTFHLPWRPSTFIELMWKLSSNTRWVAYLPSLARFVVAFEHTHTHRSNADLVVCHVLGGGLPKLGWTHVAGEGQQTVGGSGPRWETLAVRLLLAHKSGFFLCFFACLCSTLH